MTKPGFFIVGAPKCGTTAVNEYLSQHPDIFMAEKELHYFGKDLPRRHQITQEEYISKFRDGWNKKIAGEASVWYLFSKTAAEEIKAFAPGAKILIMLRNPVDLLHSLHSQHIYDGNEDVKDFQTAIGLDEERKKGNKQPRSVDFAHLPPYIDSVLFSQQVKRYLDVFGKENVHIILFDDFASDRKVAMDGLLKFLGVTTEFIFHDKVINSNKRIASFRLHRLIKRPPFFLRNIVRILIPSKTIRHRIIDRLSNANIEETKRDKMNPGLRAELLGLLKDDISKLSALTGKDLSGWINI